MFHKELGKGPGTAAYGQCNSSNLYKQDGGHPLPYPVTVSQEPLGLVSKSQCFDKGTVHSRNPERTSRSRVQNFPGLQRLETSPSHFQFDLPEMGSSEHRPICISSHISTRPICELEAGSVSSAHGRLHPRLGNISGYAFPPFSVIGRCLQLVQSQRVEHLVIVTPVWPTQTWYPLLLTLCIDFPILLPVQKDLLTREGRNHPLPQLQLAGWLLSTVATKREDFLAKLETSSSQLGGKTPQVHIPQPRTSGVAGVLNEGQLIPFHHL